jgi:gamma-glutamyltranspeptidase / glutathione hydrolase
MGSARLIVPSRLTSVGLGRRQFAADALSFAGVSFAGMSFAAIEPVFAGDRVAGASFASRSAVLAPHAAAATAHPLATQAAIDVLHDGGSAADAAITAAAVLAVVEPMMSGPGGDLFAIVWNPATRKVEALSSAGAAPAALTRDAVMARGAKLMPQYGGLSITVPGAVAGWEALHSRLGRLPFARLLAPAIDYAENGFPVSRQIAHDWQSISWFKSGAAVLGSFDELNRVFAPRGRVPKMGERFANPDLAQSLREISASGWAAFTKGRLGRAISDATSQIGSAITQSDFARHRATWGDTIHTRYRGHEVHQVPLPGQGLTTLQILNLLEQFDVAALGQGTTASARLMIEAVRVTYEDRARLYADPDFVSIDTATLLSKAYAKKRKDSMVLDGRIDGRASRAPAIETGDTTMIVTADPQGQMVSLITSVSGPFGSGIVAPGTGFPLQNRAVGFALAADHPNVLMPGKRPFHTIIPGFVTKNGEPWLAFGVMGGAIQPQGQAQILVNMIDYGLDVQEAGDAPRFRLVGGAEPNGSAAPITVRLERGWRPEVAKALDAAGYHVEVGVNAPDVRFGGYQGIQRYPDTGYFAAGSEMRSDGGAAGF